MYNTFSVTWTGMVSTHFLEIKMLIILNERKSQEGFAHIGKKHDREGRGIKKMIQIL